MHNNTENKGFKVPFINLNLLYKEVIIISNDINRRITTRYILDDSGYNSTLKGINSSLKENKNYLKAATSGLEAYGRTTANIKSVQESLQSQLASQNKKLEIYKNSIAKTTEKLESNIEKREKLKQSLEQEKAKLESLKKVYGENNQAVTNSQKKLDELQEEYNKVNSSVENGAKRIQGYKTQLNKTEAEINKTTNSINKFNKEIKENGGAIDSASFNVQKLGTHMQKAGGAISSVGDKLTTRVSLPLAGVGIAAAKVGMDFEAEMDKVSAISGATGEDFQKLKAKAEEMGAKTKFSASEAGQGLEYMAMA
ncbi:hypothetical protein P6P37_06010 [Clostridium perfringens]|nr:hypothetical protein [Clostridium perfringens]MDK0834396.1 hypothetical protein [Clostridium perfringens]